MKYTIEQKAENIYNFVEDCYNKVNEGETLSRKELRKISDCYDTYFLKEYQEYFEKEMLSNDLYYMFDEIICNSDF